MDDKEELRVLQFLENVNATVTHINADLLEAVKNVEPMTIKECNASLAELKNTQCDLRNWSQTIRTAIFKIVDHLRPLLRDLLMVLMIN